MNKQKMMRQRTKGGRGCPDTPAGPGAVPTPGAPPLRSSRRGQAAAARVGTLCATASRWDSLVAGLVAHGCLPLRYPLALRPPAATFLGGPGSGHL
jgi:hypothetical protein